MRRTFLRRMAALLALSLGLLPLGAGLAETSAPQEITVETEAPAGTEATAESEAAAQPEATVESEALPQPDITLAPDLAEPDPEKGLEIYCFDLERVGGILIRCDGAACLVGVGYARDAEIVLPYLQALGVEKLDCYIGTHAHADHIEGAPKMIYALRPDVVYVPHKRVWSTIISYASKVQKDVVKNTPCQILKHGEGFRLGGADMLCLGPINVRNVDIASNSENENSLICRLTYGAHTFLFTGDTTDAELRAVNRKYPGALRCDVFKNPHHNGHHADDVLDLMQAKAAVFCADNDHLPGDDYLRQLKNHKCAWFITGSRCDGNILLASDGEDLQVYCGYPMESVKLDPTPVLIPGATWRVTGELAPAKRANPERWLNWRSSDPGVATVSKGTITAVGVGDATITATAINGVSDSIEVRVLASTVLVDRDKLTVKVGEAENLRAKIVGEGAGGSVEWHSDDTDIAMVDGDGEVIGMGVGETRIVARYGEAEAVCTVTVEERPVKSVDLDKGKLRMKVGESYQLRCVVRPSDATDKRLEWASSDESVATVDEFGNVTAVGRGSAKIGVRAASGVYDVCKVKVE